MDLKKIKPAVKGASKAGYHSISAMFRCPKEYQLSAIRQISVPRTLLPDPLAIGSLFHEGRAHWFQSGFPTGAKYWQPLISYINASADTSNPPIRQEAVNRTLSYLEQYCTYWAMRTKPNVVHTEYEVGPAPLAEGDPLYQYRTARLDDVSEYPEANYKLCIGECKTTSVSVEDVVNEYTLHGQPMLQYLLWQMSANGHKKHVKKHGPVNYVLLDVIVKGYGKERCQFGRHAIPFTDFSLDWYKQSMTWALEVANQMKYDTLEVPRIPTSCTRLVGRARIACPFRDLCRFGKGAANRYVDAEGHGLSNPKYNEYNVKPWEGQSNV